MSSIASNKSMQLAMKESNNINLKITEFNDGSREGIAAFGSDIRQLILETGLAKKKSIHFSEVCPHEDNRDGELLVPIRVWVLLLKISQKGWSDAECALALTCAIPSSPVGDQWKAKAMLLAQNADGLLAPYQPELLTAASAAGSHTTAVLQLLDYAASNNVKCPDPQFDDLCQNGVLSPARIFAKQPSIGKAVSRGTIEYLHVNAEIVELCPDLMRLLSEAKKHCFQ
jgi:hypothetical protein